MREANRFAREIASGNDPSRFDFPQMFSRDMISLVTMNVHDLRKSWLGRSTTALAGEEIGLELLAELISGTGE